MQKSFEIAEAIIVPETISLSGKLTILFTIIDLRGPAGVPPDFVWTGKIQELEFPSKKLDYTILFYDTQSLGFRASD